MSLLDDEDDSFLTFSPRTTACFVNYESPVDLLGDDSSEEIVTDLPPRRDINIPTISESPIASGIQNTVIKPHHVSTFWFQRRNAESSTVISAVQVQSLLIIQSINQKGQQDGRINVDIYRCSGEPSSSNVQLISSHQIASQRQSATRDHSPVTFPCPLLILSHKEGEKIDSCEISHSISPNLYNQLFGSPYSEKRVPMLLIGCPSGSLSYAPLDEVATPSCNILSRILCSDTSTITGIHCASMNSVATVDTLIVSFQSGKLQVLIANKRDGKMNSLIIATDNIGCQIYLSTTLNHHSIILCNYQNTKVIRLHHLRKYLSDQTINKPDLPINHILAKDLQDITDLELTTVLRMQNLSDSTFLALNRLGFVAYCDMEQPKIKPLPTCAFDNTEDCKGKLQLFAKMEHDLEASSVQMKEVDDSLMQLNYAVQVIKTVEPNSSQSPFAVKDIEICDNLRPRNFSLQAILSYQGQKELGAGWSVMASAGIHITHATSVSNILCVTEGCCTKETSYCSQYATQSLAGGVSNSLFYVTLDLPLNWSLHNLLISFSLTYDTSVPAALVGVRSTKLTALLHRQILSPVDFLQPLFPFVHLPAPLSVTGVKADSFPTGLSSSEPQESLNLSIKEEALRQCLKCSQLVGSDPLKSFLSLILKKNCLSLLKTLEDGQFLLQCALPGSNPVRLVLKEAVEKDLELTVQSSSFLVAAAMVNAIVNRMVSPHIWHMYMGVWQGVYMRGVARGIYEGCGKGYI